ncbi:DUF885 domain-containing protein [Sphingomonas spermidinifaciens]|uniref:DUF885 domain-containing protein n=1 Tax=Sphingomonas spermidinifaciens TaxID=1141889 RepID=A0A2A4B7K1_9SPHN|nr:DUF885 domain-containing protein [Sphingomonas spermidinifaciens]PCD03738.1 DUF885 domain-containing protein [Sphingomonas spermidinifaciens]
MALSFRLLLSAALALPLAAGASAQQAVPAASAAEAEDAKLNQFLDAAFDASIALSPEQTTSLGGKANYDRLDDYTGATAEKRLQMAEATLAEMKRRFDPAKLGAQGKLSYRLFEFQVANQRRQHQWRDYSFPVSTNGSPAGDIPVFLLNQHKVGSVTEAEAYIARIRETERVMREVVARMRAQAAKGIVPPQMVFAPARNDAKKILVGAPFTAGPDSTVMADFAKKVAALDAPPATKEKLLADARNALTGPFKTGYDTLFAALDEIEGKAKGNNGAWSLPNGDAYYAARLFNFTTTDLTADQIHQLGLRQVASIRAEMDAIRKQTGFKGDLKAFFAFIRDDPRFKYENSEAGKEAYLADARAVIAEVMGKAPQYFSVLPKAPLEVRAVEKWREATASTAFYNRPAPDGSRPGIYYVNLADMGQVQKVQNLGISVHEGAPGHHFQIARAQELTGLPKFRKLGGYSAYTEGWGLYTERLADEMGIYKDPYQRFGMLSLQMWRAIRLVVDTGMHSKRWTREQAQQYFRDNSSLSEIDLKREVDRYINNPGQATSYMVGQLKIAELRDRAKKALGPKFDIREFHEAVLANGMMPLAELEQVVDGYIAAKRG